MGRRHRRLGRGRRHGRQGADRGRRRRRHARGGRRLGHGARLEDVRVAVRLAAARRGDAGAAVRRVRRADSAAGRSKASPTRARRGTRFDWWRARMLGGRTNHWGRISLRFGPDDFRRKSLDGLGDDWPITLRRRQAVLRPGRRARSASSASDEGLPNEPDGIFQPPPKPRCYELLVKQAADRLNITCIPSRLSILTQPLNGRPACHYCGQCGRGCATHSNFSSPSVLLPPALATGRLTLVTNAMAREVTIGRERAGDRRLLHRQDDRPRERTCAARDRRARGERVRDRRAAAQLEVVAIPARPRQLAAAWSASTSPTPPAPSVARLHPAA